MALLIVGLVLFLGIHSVSIVAEDFRNKMVERSEGLWKGVYSVVSLLGVYLIAQGYGEAKLTTTVLYTPPAAMRHVVALLLLPTFVLFFAPYFPGRIKTKTKHPQLVAVKLWALSHLLVNGSVADLILFGSFLAWAVFDRISLKRRTPRALKTAAERPANDAIVVVLGLAAYGAFTFWAHAKLLGVAPFG